VIKITMHFLSRRMQRLVTAGLLPDRAGQPAKVWAHVSLADLMMLDGSSALLEQWTARVRAQWAAHRAGASLGGSDGAAWLDGDAARAAACDASVTPVVTGEVNYAVMDDLLRLCVQLDRLRHHPGGEDTGQHGTSTDGDAGSESSEAQTAPGPDTTLAWEALEHAIIGKAVDLVSGPGGLASFLRRRQLGARLGGPSLPLDIGYSETIPAGIRNAVILRDKHCQWAGRCNQPAAACQVHHVTHKANGGKTSVRDCVLLCWFHHQVVIHRWGWTLVLNPDGTTTAWNPDKTRGCLKGSQHISSARQFMAAFAQVGSFSNRGSLKNFRHAFEIRRSRFNPVSQKHIQDDFRLGTPIRLCWMFRATAGKQFERKRVSLFVDPVVFRQRVVNVPQHKQRAHDRSGFPHRDLQVRDPSSTTRHDSLARPWSRDAVGMLARRAPA